MEKVLNFNGVPLGGVGAAAATDMRLLPNCCAVCGRASADLDIDWDNAAADPAFYYMPTEAGAAQSISTTILKS